MEAIMISRLCIVFAIVLIMSGCATVTTASHFTKDSPMIYSGTRLDIHASEHDEDTLRVYKERYGVEPPPYPILDLPFSFLFDSFILGPIVWPVFLYEAVFD